MPNPEMYSAVTHKMVEAFRQMPGTCSCIADDPRENIRAALAVVLAMAEREAAEELRELRQLFALQYRRMSEATERWRAEDPETRALIMPDLGTLLRWLMDQAELAGQAD